MDRSLLGWILLLVIGFPMVGIILNEIAERLIRRQHPLGPALQKVRLYVLPSLALLLVMRQLLDVAGTENSARIVETLTWIAVLVSGMALINALLTPSKKPIQWQLRVPKLFFQAARAAIVLSIGSYMLNGIWQIDLSGVATALGIGSLVIALALQETLSNLVSGFLLLFARPFEIGDWIDCNGVQARVIDLNWWSVTLEDRFWGYKITIPNGSLAKATITNYGQGGMWKGVSASFSYGDPPNQVVAGLNSLVTGIDDIESEGIAGINSYEDGKINYDLRYKVMPEKARSVSNQLNNRIYYLAKRQGFTMSYWTEVQYDFEGTDRLPFQAPPNQQSIITNYLRSLPYLTNLNDQELHHLGSQARFETYGAGELILQEERPEDAFYILFEGEVRTWTSDRHGKLQEINRLGRGDVFGELAIFPGDVSPIAATAVGDVELVVLYDKDIVQLIQKNAKFGLEMTQFIEERKRTIRLIKGREIDETDKD